MSYYSGGYYGGGSDAFYGGHYYGGGDEDVEEEVYGGYYGGASRPSAGRSTKRMLHAAYAQVAEGRTPTNVKTTLTASDLTRNKRGVLVSKKKSSAAVRKRLADNTRQWRAHVAQVQRQYPNLPLKAVLQRASSTYRRVRK